MKFILFKYTDAGPRNENQDSLAYKKHEGFFVACIADGVGGSYGGKLASQKSVDDYILNVINPNVNQQNIISDIHNSILELQKLNKANKGMATTFTGCIVTENRILGVHLGDSRLCILRGNGIKQLTISHTEVNRLVKSGKLKLEEVKNYPRRNILESAIGITHGLTIQEFEFDLQNRDRILLTTDGVHDLISKMEFRDMSVNNESVESFGKNIAECLKGKKATDNLTFMLIEVQDKDA